MCVCLISAYEKLEINYEKVCEYVITVITTRVQSWIKHFAENLLKIRWSQMQRHTFTKTTKIGKIRKRTFSLNSY